MMVLGAVLIVPYAIFCLPVVLAEIFDKNYENGDRSFGERLGISVFVYLAIAGLFMIGEFFASLLGFLKWGEDATVPGMSLTVGIIAITAVVYTRKIIIRRRDKLVAIEWEKRLNGEHIPDSLGTVIADAWSAFYDKHCPRISWIDPVEKDYTDAMEAEDLEPVEGQELGVHTDPVLGTTYGLKNITNKESETLNFPNLKP
jgi:hypothetical protein